MDIWGIGGSFDFVQWLVDNFEQIWAYLGELKGAQEYILEVLSTLLQDIEQTLNFFPGDVKSAIVTVVSSFIALAVVRWLT